jgi:hypothetical protein
MYACILSPWSVTKKAFESQREEAPAGRFES